jgi:hypothetical protein
MVCKVTVTPAVNDIIGAGLHGIVLELRHLRHCSVELMDEAR